MNLLVSTNYTKKGQTNFDESVRFERCQKNSFELEIKTLESAILANCILHPYKDENKNRLWPQSRGLTYAQLRYCLTLLLCWTH